MAGIVKNNVLSEIGELEGVIIHTPGPEVENMTPQNAERALYSDILNLNVGLKEYEQFRGALQKLTKVFEVRDLLTEILDNQKVKNDLVRKIFRNEGIANPDARMLSLPNDEVARQLLEGVIMVKDNLSKYLSKERYLLRPLHNFFFTRDASVTIFDKVLIGRMASRVREREAIIMEAIFDYHPTFNTKTFNPIEHESFTNELTIEGGDILVARHDTLLVGIGSRTTPQGIDYLIEQMKSHKKKRHIIVQELPFKPESFIHLDMVFTFLDQDKCMIYEPIILKPNKLQTVHIEIDNGKVKSIHQEENIVSALKGLGMDLKPIFCGGIRDSWIQEREQWHSGANFLALAPGKIIGYGRNVYTIEELNNNGFNILRAEDVMKDKICPSESEKCVITIEGSELARGGGGARCMSMPVKRKPLE
ncbi:MAG: arginine deiminase [Bacteroidales bacterium]|nr:arginine deiminase [Bacteroidales bacterium]